MIITIIADNWVARRHGSSQTNIGSGADQQKIFARMTAFGQIELSPPKYMNKVRFHAPKRFQFDSFFFVDIEFSRYFVINGYTTPKFPNFQRSTNAAKFASVLDRWGFVRPLHQINRFLGGVAHRISISIFSLFIWVNWLIWETIAIVSYPFAKVCLATN